MGKGIIFSTNGTETNIHAKECIWTTTTHHIQKLTQMDHKYPNVRAKTINLK